MSSRWTYGDKEDGFLAIPVAQGIIKTSPGSVSTSSETSEDDISPRSFSRERVAVVERVDSTIPPFVAAVETFVALGELGSLTQAFMLNGVDILDKIQFIKSLIYLNYHDLALSCCLGSLYDDPHAKNCICEYFMEEGKYGYALEILKDIEGPYAHYGHMKLLKAHQTGLAEELEPFLSRSLVVRSLRREEGKTACGMLNSPKSAAEIHNLEVSKEEENVSFSSRDRTFTQSDLGLSESSSGVIKGDIVEFVGAGSMDLITPPFVTLVKLFDALGDIDLLSEAFMDEQVDVLDKVQFIKSLIYLNHDDLALSCCLGFLQGDHLAKNSVCEYFMEKGKYGKALEILKVIQGPYAYYGQVKLLQANRKKLAEELDPFLGLPLTLQNS